MTQDIEISLLVAESLAIELTPETRAMLARRQDAGDLVGRLQAIGGALGLSYLTRTLDASGIREALQVTSAPLVLIGEHGDAVVIGLARSPREEPAVQVTPDGMPVPLAGAPARLADTIMSIVGRTPTAMSPLALAAPMDPLRTTLEMMIETRSMPRMPARVTERNVFSRVAHLLSRDKRDIVLLLSLIHI